MDSEDKKNLLMLLICCITGLAVIFGSISLHYRYEELYVKNGYQRVPMVGTSNTWWQKIGSETVTQSHNCSVLDETK